MRKSSLSLCTSLFGDDVIIWNNFGHMFVVCHMFIFFYSFMKLVGEGTKVMIRQRLSKEKPLESFCFSRSRCGGGGWWQLLKCHLWGLVLDLQVRLYRVGFSRVSTSLTNQKAAFWNAELSLVNWGGRRLRRRQPLKVPGCGSVYSKKTSQRSIECGDDVIVHLVWLEHLMVMSLYTFSTITAIYE